MFSGSKSCNELSSRDELVIVYTNVHVIVCDASGSELGAAANELT